MPAGSPSRPAQSAWSDPVTLPFVLTEPDPVLVGRRLAVSFHVVDDSGPMTWHAKALTTSYLTPPGAGAKGAADGVLDFPYSTTSWYFLDAVDMAAPADTRVVVALGDSITDGTASTLNGDDRWPNVLLQRIQAAGDMEIAVVNAGIGGNQVIGPASYTVQKPFPGGPSALDRLDRDVLSLSGVSAVIWLEGINDFSQNGNANAQAVVDGMKTGIARIRAKFPNVRVIGATVTTALGSTGAGHGSAEQDLKRKTLNECHPPWWPVRRRCRLRRRDARPGHGPDEAGSSSPRAPPADPARNFTQTRAGYEAMAASIDLKTLLQP